MEGSPARDNRKYSQTIKNEGEPVLNFCFLLSTFLFDFLLSTFSLAYNFTVFLEDSHFYKID